MSKELQGIEGVDYVVSRLNGKRYRTITLSHVKANGLKDLNEYKTIFSDDIITCGDNGKKRLKYYKPSKEELYNLYCIKEMSAGDIAKLIGSSEASIYKWIHDYSFKIRSHSDSHLTNRYKDIYVKELPPKSDLIDYYWNKNLSFTEIGNIYNKNGGQIFTWFINYNIPCRTLSESKIGHEVTGETRLKIGLSCKGNNLREKNGNWNGGSSNVRSHVLLKNWCIKLNDYFVGSHAHHILYGVIIYIPAELHQSVYHNMKTGKNMKVINELAFQYLNGYNNDGNTK